MGDDLWHVHVRALFGTGQGGERARAPEQQRSQEGPHVDREAVNRAIGTSTVEDGPEYSPVESAKKTGSFLEGTSTGSSHAIFNMQLLCDPGTCAQPPAPETKSRRGHGHLPASSWFLAQPISRCPEAAPAETHGELTRLGYHLVAPLLLDSGVPDSARPAEERPEHPSRPARFLGDQQGRHHGTDALGLRLAGCWGWESDLVHHALAELVCCWWLQPHATSVTAPIRAIWVSTRFPSRTALGSLALSLLT